MTPRRRAKADRERRSNLALRELLDDLVDHVRLITRTITEMRPDELSYAQQRLEWLADEIWRTALETQEDSDAGT